jgi:hypothetical protein
MLSKSLKLSDIPDSMWLPPEMRARLSVGEYQSVNSRNCQDRLIDCLKALSERIMHAESMLSKLDIETRLTRLEFDPTSPQFKPPSLRHHGA